MKTTPDNQKLMDRINCVVNRTLIADSTNKRISKQSPSQYLQKVIPTGLFKPILKTHFILTDALSAMQNDDFETFVEAREKTLLAEITKRVGQSHI